MVDFTADIVEGAPPLTVNFTDITVGSHNRWLWEFGDGKLASEQNPTHVYAVNGTYSVSLTVWQDDGVAVIGHTVTSKSVRTGEHALIGTAFTNFTNATWSPVDPGTGISDRYGMVFAGGLYTYQAYKSEIEVDLTTVTGDVLIVMRATFTGEKYSIPKSGLKITGHGEATRSLPDNVFFNVAIPQLGGINNYEILDKEDYGDFMQVEEGWAGNVMASNLLFVPGSKSKTTKSGFIYVGPPVADFDVSASSGIIWPSQVSGVNPVSVTFRDLSSASPTSWSWRKRRSGTGDPFIEFSTAQNPFRYFNKQSP